MSDAGAARTASAAVGLLGGSFDPVHIGHLRIATEVCEALALPALRFVPSGVPNLRAAPQAGAADRISMLRAATAGSTRFSTDTREIDRGGVSFTIDTLLALRAELGAAPLLFVLGSDAFAALPRWHRWRELLDHAHIVVVTRPGAAPAVDGELAGLLASRAVTDGAALLAGPAGRIMLMPVPLLEVSSSDIRARVRAGRDISHLVPDSVRDIIIRNGLYR